MPKGILLANLGTPDSPSVQDVRRYLAEFLWDPRVIKVWRPAWWVILNFVILNTRPKKSAKAYASIWSDQGSPLLAISRQQKDKLAEAITDVPIELGMRYGTPSIESAVQALCAHDVDEILVLPLYPQFSFTTASSVEDEVNRVVKKLNTPKLSCRLINDYHDFVPYIRALAKSIRNFQSEQGSPDKLMFSFHGIPQEYADDGDPYAEQCQVTATLLAQALNLAPEQWQLTFQSRLGPKQWLQPYTDKTLEAWGHDGIQSVQVVCPGFSADCLETLEDVAMANRELFLQAGGKQFQYIPCLNSSPEHIEMMKKLLIENGL